MDRKVGAGSYIFWSRKGRQTDDRHRLKTETMTHIQRQRTQHNPKITRFHFRCSGVCAYMKRGRDEKEGERREQESEKQRCDAERNIFSAFASASERDKAIQEHITRYHITSQHSTRQDKTTQHKPNL